ncbi:[LSU ribosomal protein L11P]-lysine N-methyltransferase [Gillisia sp. Hel1_33_143]|uniref:50S ribosomal protein L11 methyltransferase n=1 Tax=Gillisia sp. Hel1_33_143 TaxID=1336796 RepID=UPI00087A58F4|nr:50S ribosomal protein L11 methyltransferase [Gillisia sp. Hel1_33_143]SDS18452.1 [LSU ribosomal protein L11P]-lysine N-methyltransferase [Gillisia sp. Hel1_33_143]
MNYLEFQFKIEPLQPASEILIAELGNVGFESFVENEEGITAYIQVNEFQEGSLKDIYVLNSDEFEISYTTSEIEQVNWNSEWEKNFNPIIVDNKCSVRAPFHVKPETEFDIVIEPKMSFGTGHHATTHMMLQHILKDDWRDLSVLDMGCGTGVLAILAGMKGANPIDAIDIDNWCYLNTMENVERNNANNISVYEGTAALLEGRSYDRIIANINRNILLEDISVYSQCLKSGGKLYLSGFYVEDIPMIEKECNANNLNIEATLDRENWAAVSFTKV